MKRIHLIGIGGIGMSGLAQYYLSQDFEVTGSDLTDSPIIKRLKKSGAKIFVGQHKAKNLSNHPDLVIYSAAVEKNNPEMVSARQQKIKCFSYAQALGQLTRKFFTIAVSGTHGKSTIASMIALILNKAGLDPTVIVGTKIKEFKNNNFRKGKSSYLVIEADEYQASFLNYWPQIILLSNIEEEHLDYYKDLEDIISTFREYINHLGRKGVLVANVDDKNIRKFVETRFRQTNYYLGQPEAKRLKKILKVPGQHNLSNALGALAVARILRVPDKVSFKALSEYRGVWRRFEYQGQIKGAKIYDDYGHHPTEIEATLKAARELLKKNKSRGKLWLIFQPHQYQRTHKLFERFVNAFDRVDKLILLPIYSVAGREKGIIKKKVSSKKMRIAIEKHWQEKKQKKEVLCLANFQASKKYLKNNLKKGDLCLIMGAGDVWQLTEMLLK